MKIQFSGRKLKNFKKYRNIYYDSVIPDDTIMSEDFNLFLNTKLKDFKFRRLDFKSAYVIVLMGDELDVVRIGNMNNYKKIARAYGATDVEFVHNYLLNNRGSGKLMFPTGSFESVKSIYR